MNSNLLFSLCCGIKTLGMGHCHPGTNNYRHSVLPTLGTYFDLGIRCSCFCLKQPVAPHQKMSHTPKSRQRSYPGVALHLHMFLNTDSHCSFFSHTDTGLTSRIPMWQSHFRQRKSLYSTVDSQSMSAVVYTRYIVSHGTHSHFLSNRVCNTWTLVCATRAELSL